MKTANQNGWIKIFCKNNSSSNYILSREALGKSTFFKIKGHNFGTRHKFSPDYSFAICDCLKLGLSNTKNRQNRTKKQN